jgi:hypothetical protein
VGGINCLASNQKCQQLLVWHAGNDINFSDEELFLLQKPLNQQNDWDLLCFVERYIISFFLLIASWFPVLNPKINRISKHATEVSQHIKLCCKAQTLRGSSVFLVTSASKRAKIFTSLFAIRHGLHFNYTFI